MLKISLKLFRQFAFELLAYLVSSKGRLFLQKYIEIRIEKGMISRDI